MELSSRKRQGKDAAETRTDTAHQEFDSRTRYISFDDIGK